MRGTRWPAVDGCMPKSMSNVVSKQRQQPPPRPARGCFVPTRSPSGYPCHGSRGLTHPRDGDPRLRRPQPATALNDETRKPRPAARCLATAPLVGRSEGRIGSGFGGRDKICRRARRRLPFSRMGEGGAERRMRACPRKRGSNGSAAPLATSGGPSPLPLSHPGEGFPTPFAAAHRNRDASSLVLAGEGGAPTPRPSRSAPCRGSSRGSFRSRACRAASCRGPARARPSPCPCR